MGNNEISKSNFVLKEIWPSIMLWQCSISAKKVNRVQMLKTLLTLCTRLCPLRAQRKFITSLTVVPSEET